MALGSNSVSGQSILRLVSFDKSNSGYFSEPIWLVMPSFKSVYRNLDAYRALGFGVYSESVCSTRSSAQLGIIPIEFETRE